MTLLTQSFPFLSESKTEFDELCKDADKLIMKYKKDKMSETEKIRGEAMEEILSNLGINVSIEQAQQIATDFKYHLDMEGEMESHRFAGFKEECSSCKSLEQKLKDANESIEVFRNSVMKRRNASSVWIENGEVKYEK